MSSLDHSLSNLAAADFGAAGRPHQISRTFGATALKARTVIGGLRKAPTFRFIISAAASALINLAVMSFITHIRVEALVAWIF
ncbi:MAG: hypothetical protein K2P80_06000 [Beijerinckiaceae bacterium]|nr:hypothetical protein [Beijerinckiaceae bacterium]